MAPILFTAFLLFNTLVCRGASDFFNSSAKTPISDLHHRYRVLGGSEATANEFPWQVSLQSRRGHFCGGSILDETHVITAAHCVRGKAASDYRVVAGAHNLNDGNEGGRQIKSVATAVIHPKFSGFWKSFDVAILVLSSPLEFKDGISSINLPPAGHEPFGKCVTSGWGRANLLLPIPISFLLETPGPLEKVNVTIIPRAVCRIPYLIGTRSWLTSTMICGAGILKGICNGDSGGPLVCYDIPNKIGLQVSKPYLAGITSFGVDPCGHPLYPDVWANVAGMRDFIDKALQM